MAKALGLTIPPTLSSIANKVIEEIFCTASFNGGKVTQWVKSYRDGYLFNGLRPGVWASI